MKTLERFWGLYKKSAWLPVVITIILVNLPSLFVQVIFISSGIFTNKSSLIEMLSVVLIVIFWLFVPVSILAMFFAGAYQLKNEMKLRGYINLTLAVFFLLVFVVPVWLFFISPPGVN